LQIVTSVVWNFSIDRDPIATSAISAIAHMVNTKIAPFKQEAILGGVCKIRFGGQLEGKN
jgi:hypothetical protein